MRMYAIRDNNGEFRCAVVADTAKEAKKIVYGDERVDDLSWIEFTAEWMKGANITGFEKGIFEDCWEAIQRGIFNAQGEGCEYCLEVEKCTKFLKVTYETAETESLLL